MDLLGYDTGLICGYLCFEGTYCLLFQGNSDLEDTDSRFLQNLMVALTHHKYVTRVYAAAVKLACFQVQYQKSFPVIVNF
jgi:hypothetical protein